MKNNISEARRSYALTRAEGEFSQKDAAACFGVSLSAYQKWEQGAGKLNGEILGAIADKYGCSVEYLLCRTENPSFMERRSEGAALTTDERALVGLYRRMDDENRKQFLELAGTFVIASEKIGAGTRADVERAGRSLV